MNIAALKEAAERAPNDTPVYVVSGNSRDEQDAYISFRALANPSAILSLIERVETYEAALRHLASVFDEESYPHIGSLERSAGDLARRALSNPTETVK